MLKTVSIVIVNSSSSDSSSIIVDLWLWQILWFYFLIFYLNISDRLITSRPDNYLRVCEEICELVGDGVQPFKPAVLNRIKFLQKKR